MIWSRPYTRMVSHRYAGANGTWDSHGARCAFRSTGTDIRPRHRATAPGASRVDLFAWNLCHIRRIGTASGPGGGASACSSSTCSSNTYCICGRGTGSTWRALADFDGAWARLCCRSSGRSAHTRCSVPGCAWRWCGTWGAPCSQSSRRRWRIRGCGSVDGEWAFCAAGKSRCRLRKCTFGDSGVSLSSQRPFLVWPAAAARSDGEQPGAAAGRRSKNNSVDISCRWIPWTVSEFRYAPTRCVLYGKTGRSSYSDVFRSDYTARCVHSDPFHWGRFANKERIGNHLSGKYFQYPCQQHSYHHPLLKSCNRKTAIGWFKFFRLQTLIY